ncbi:hypothetical protein SAMN05216312_10358 [Cohnella sp. OV330]|nr:hypothetical protein SAMN05216312_10358 [Cohnella sp. OV330]
MKFGIIGAGNIGSIIAEKLVANGHEVKIADARGIKRLEGKELPGKKVTVEEAGIAIDVLIVSIPLHALPSIRHVLASVGEEVVVVDTSNYYPQRDNKIEEIEKGTVESVWVSKQLGRPVIKAFNNLLASTLQNEGTPEGTRGRIAMAIAGDDLSKKQIVMEIVNEMGFDTVDSGSLEDSWRQQPGTPAYCTELTKEELAEALKKADKDKAPLLRDRAIEKLSAPTSAFSIKDVVHMNREIYNS